MEINNLQPGMELMSKHDDWKFIELMLRGTKGGDPTKGFLTHEIGTNVIKFYTLHELATDFKPLQK